MTLTTGPHRGRYLADFTPGEVIQHPLGRTILDSDNTWFTLLTMNTAAVHFDQNLAKASNHERCLVNSCLTISVVVGISVIDLTQNGIYNLGWDDVRLLHPVYVGDTLYAESRILSARPSASRPEAGIVSARTRGLNQEGATVITYSRTFMVYRSPSAQPDVFPQSRHGWPDDD